MFAKYWQLVVNIMAILTGLALLFTYSRMNFDVMTLKDHSLTLWGIILLVGSWCSYTSTLHSIRSPHQVQ